jgi:hypothetical protein
MSSVVISGDTSGTVTVTVPATAGSNTITLPAVTGTAVVAGQNSAITAGTSQASTSGTAISFTSIPSWVKRITVMCGGISTSGTSDYIVRLGTSGGIVSTGYDSMRGQNNNGTGSISRRTDSFVISSAAASSTYQGNIVITNLSGNIWTSTGLFCDSTTTFNSSSGYVSLGAVLTQIAITTVNGTDTFDAGSINILYE